MTHCDAVPILVNHHDAQEHAQRKEKQSVDIMFDCITDRNAECKEENLGNDKEGCAKENIADGPSVVKRAED